MRPGNNRIELRAPADGWLVVSEKLALYPGWSASIHGVPAEIVRANGVISAISVGAGNTVQFSYEPRYFRLGISLFAVMLLAVGITEFRHRRRGLVRSGSTVHDTETAR